MAIYDLGTASLAANGEVTGVGTTWKAPLTLIRVGATIVFKTEPVQIYTISEIISDTKINVYNPNSETVPAGTGYAILAHDGITVQGLAQDVAETLRYYQSREAEITDSVEALYLKKDDNLASVGNANTARVNINAASLGANSFAGNQAIIQQQPQLRLETTSVGDSVVGKSFTIENNIGNNVNMIFLNKGSSVESRTVRLVKPSSASTVFIPFNGGLADNGRSVPDSDGGDFNTFHQGWSVPTGSAANSPVSGGTYGSCFTQCTQGTRHGQSTSRDGLWYQQRFYSTENEIYTRTQTNNNAWTSWLKVTTSSVSDERLKDIYGDLDLSESLDNICKMEFKNFKFKDDEKQRQRRGVISQQIMNIDKEYVWEVGGYYHLDQTPMLLDGLAAIKALKIKSDKSDQEISALRAEIAELKEMVKQLMQ